MPTVDCRPTPAAPFLSAAPLLGKTPAQIAERLRAFGAHPPHPGARERTAALTMRADVTVGDALESLSAALNQVRGVLAMLEVDDTIPEYARHAISGALVQAQLASAHHCVIDHAIREQQPEDTAVERSRWIEAARTVAQEVAVDLGTASRLIGIVLANGDNADDEACGALAIVERCGLKVDQIAGPMERVHDRPLDWIMSPRGREAMTALGTQPLVVSA